MKKNNKCPFLHKSSGKCTYKGNEEVCIYSNASKCIHYRNSKTIAKSPLHSQLEPLEPISETISPLALSTTKLNLYGK